MSEISGIVSFGLVQESGRAFLWRRNFYCSFNVSLISLRSIKYCQGVKGSSIIFGFESILQEFVRAASAIGCKTFQLRFLL